MDTKRMILFLTALSLFCSAGSAFCQPERDSETYQLIITLNDIITKKCHLTELSFPDPVSIKNEIITININFNNRTLRSFWSPEVAVQYIFDAALYNITKAIWNGNPGKYKDFKKVLFKVDIRPHDIPPLISFKITLEDWKSYINGGKKEDLYKKMIITSGGNPFKFDPHLAADIE